MVMILSNDFEKKSYVYTNNNKCLGCNKCIFVCPTNANEAFFEAEQCKVSIKNGFCVSCGQCLSICDHGARDYTDDTVTFFNDLRNGEEISAIIAPAAKFNFLDTQKLIGYLKSIGIKKVYDVSFGADICTWAHIKAVKEHGVKNIISQPCPVVVSFIEKYYPSLIGRLSPIQSPAICVATYLKKYIGANEKIAFISPCVGKKREITSEFTNEAISYNVTFSKLNAYFNNNNINLDDFEQSTFDNMQGSIGFTFSRPGGLNENIKYHLDENIWIKQVEGTKQLGSYLKEYISDIENGEPIPFIVDALNCEDGCNNGTGTEKIAKLNKIDFIINEEKTAINKSECEALMSYFDEKLNIEHFYRQYSDKSHEYKKDPDVDLEMAYLSLGKVTEEDRTVNCFACGYGSCRDFVYNLATGHNDKNNCKHYLLNKFRRLSFVDELTGIFNRYSFATAVDKLQEHPGFVGIAYIDINGLKQANDNEGHSFGDKLIISCADILKQVFGNEVYRVGGDEFVVVSQTVSEKEFDESIEKLKQIFSEQEYLKASVGSAKSYSSHDLQQKMEEADSAMYEDKQLYYALQGGANRRRNFD